MASSSSSSSSSETSRKVATPPRHHVFSSPQRKISKKARKDVDLIALRETINQQAKYIRHLKREGADKAIILREAHRLLDLKFLDPENTEVVEPKVIKIRWLAPCADGTKIRLQHSFRSRTYVCGAEIFRTVELQTNSMIQKKKLSNCGSLIKLELISGSNHVIVQSDDRFELEIINPGPTLEDQHVFNFLATWSNIDGCPLYHTLDKVPELIDCGINLTDATFHSIENKIVRQAFRAGVSQMNLLSTDVQTSLRNIEFSKRYQGSLFTSVGIHPCQANASTPEDLVKIADILKDPANKNICVAVGEIGLDFSSHAVEKTVATTPSTPTSSSSTTTPTAEAETVDASSTTTTTASTPAALESSSDQGVIQTPNKEKQISVLLAQLDLAVQFQLPVVLHVREAHAEIIPILREWRSRLLDVMIFCFSGTEAELQDFLSLDCAVSITGLIANDTRGAHLKPLLQHIPKHRITIATDAPYLTPYAHLPKPFPKYNSPSLLPYIAQISEIYDTSITQDEFSRLVTDNARSFFRIPITLFNGSKPVGSNPVLLTTAVASTSTEHESSHSISKMLQDTKKNHQNLNLDAIDNEALPVLKRGQCYFSHQGKTYCVSLQIAAVLKKQRELLGETPVFDELLNDLVKMEAKK